jgi:hypothetical protein
MERTEKDEIIEGHLNGIIALVEFARRNPLLRPHAMSGIETRTFEIKALLARSG